MAGKTKCLLERKVENSLSSFNGRYVNNDELKYSLRSVERYAPWIRKIFIVTDDQTPEWLDIENPKIKIIDHKEILPAESLPCFNSNVLEHFLCKISNLSEYFILSNDDTFFNKIVSSTTFLVRTDILSYDLLENHFEDFVGFYGNKFSKTLTNYIVKLYLMLLN